MHTIEFVVNNDWGVGFTAQLIITNTGTESLDWSQLSFDAPFTIENIWGGRIQSDDGDRYVIDSELWNDSIAPDSRISVGFSARKEQGTDPEVNNLKVNGLGTADPMPTPPSAAEPLSPATSGDMADAGGEAMPLSDEGAVPSENAPVQPLAAAGEIIRIEAEDYTRFSDNSQGNSGGKYRNDAVDIQTTSDVGGGHNVGWIRQGEWLTYDVALPESGTYKLSARVASKRSGQFSMKASIGGEDTTFTFDGTGSWQDWKTVTSEELTLDGGNHQLRLDMLSDSFNVNYLELIPVDAGTTPPNPPTPEPTPTPVPTPPALDPNPSTGQFNYAEALQKSFLFYEAQRSGPLPDDKRLEWRGDSAVNDGADVGRDLSGGYYDAGDHVKFGFPMAASMTMLSWGVNEYEEAYSQIGQLDEALDAIKWGTDYMLKAHVTDGNGTKEFWGQVGDGHIDHSFWGAPEAMSMSRPSFKIDRQNPGTDLAAEAAAALASASIIFRSSDPTYADELLTNAEQLFEFADTHRGKYSDAIPNAGNFYNSWSGYNDELAWGAAWLYKATGEASYLQQAESIYQNRIGGLGSFAQNWDDKSYGVATLLAQETGKQEYKQDVEGWLDSWVNGTNGVQITDGGLRWVGKWGSGRLAASTAFVAGVYADTVGDPAGQYGALVETTIDYLLGDNPRNSSYVVGFGENSPLRPHHRGAGSTPNSSAPNEHILYGALVGGPDQPNDFAYEDDRSNYVTNEVALDYNAGFTGALAYMVDNFGGDPLSNEELNALPGIVVVE